MINVGPSSANQRNVIKMALRLRADNGPFIVVIWILTPLIKYKKLVRVGPPLTKLSGSAHVSYHTT